MEGENTQVNIGEEKKKAKATVQWKQDAFNSALFIELIKKTPKSWEEFYAGMNAHYKRDTTENRTALSIMGNCWRLLSFVRMERNMSGECSPKSRAYTTPSPCPLMDTTIENTTI